MHTHMRLFSKNRSEKVFVYDVLLAKRTRIIVFLIMLSLMPACLSTGHIVSLNLKEEQVNAIIRASMEVNASSAGSDFQFEVSRIDMQDGLVRVFGDYRSESGGSVSGSIDVSMSALDGSLKVEIISVDIQGVSLEDARVQRINEHMAEAFTQFVSESRGKVEFIDVEVYEEALKMVIRIIP